METPGLRRVGEVQTGRENGNIGKQAGAWTGSRAWMWREPPGTLRVTGISENEQSRSWAWGGDRIRGSVTLRTWLWGWLSRKSKSKAKDAWLEHPFPFPTPGILPGKTPRGPEEPLAHQAWHGPPAAPNVGHAHPVPCHAPAVPAQSQGSSLPFPSLGNGFAALKRHRRRGRGHPPAWHQRRCSCGKSAVAAGTFSP